jgi:hypothetical protein
MSRGSKEGVKYNIGKLFFIDNKLYRRLEIRRHEGIVVCWSFPDRERVAFTIPDWKRRRRRAYGLKEAGQILNRSHVTLRKVISEGLVDKPIKTYSINGNEKYWGINLLSDTDILNLHRFFAIERASYGNLRKDGMTKQPVKALPSRAEVLARLKGDSMPTFVRTVDGQLVQVWEETAY